jgi:hypothetical protein
MGVKRLRYQQNKFGHVGKPMIGQHGFWQLAGNKSGPVVSLIANTSNARINDSIYIDKAAYEAAFGAHAKVTESPITDGAEYPFFNNRTRSQWISLQMTKLFALFIEVKRSLWRARECFSCSVNQSADHKMATNRTEIICRHGHRYGAAGKYSRRG